MKINLDKPARPKMPDTRVEQRADHLLRELRSAQRRPSLSRALGPRRMMILIPATVLVIGGAALASNLFDSEPASGFFGGFRCYEQASSDSSYIRPQGPNGGWTGPAGKVV